MGFESSYTAMYFEINIIAIILTLIIAKKSSGLSKMVAQRNFMMVLWAEGIFYVSDLFYVMMKMGAIPSSSGAIIFSKSIYFMFGGIMCFFWFIYFEYIQGTSFVKNKNWVDISSIFVIILSFVLVINVFNGITFYVDDKGIYHRGPWFILLYIVPFIYIFTTSIRVIYGLLDKSKYANKKDTLILAMYPMAPGLAAIIQYFFPMLPLACVALSVLTLLMYLNWVEEMISIDPLTRLNNRKKMSYTYEEWSAGKESGDDLYLLMIDANKFKTINDTYGHVQGDAALVRIAESLRLSCSKFSFRTSIIRYGGDEFVVFAWTDNEAQINKLKDSIRAILSDLNQKEQSPYDLTVSIGVSKANNRKMPLKDFVDAADDMLYQEKKKLGYEER